MGYENPEGKTTAADAVAALTKVAAALPLDGVRADHAYQRLLSETLSLIHI